MLCTRTIASAENVAVELACRYSHKVTVGILETNFLLTTQQIVVKMLPLVQENQKKQTAAAMTLVINI